MEITQANIAGLTTGFKATFNQSLEAAPVNYEKFATKLQSSTRYENYPFLGQMPGMREWVGDREIQSFNSYEYIVANRKFEDTIAIPREDIEDDQYGKYRFMIQGYGYAVARLPQELVIEALLNGFSNKCFDGKTFFATDHKSGGTTYSNKSTLKLSRTSFRAARTAMMSIMGDRGRSLGIIPDLLAISPKNEYAAKEIVEADQIEGTSNPDKGLAKIEVIPELAAEPDAWFLLCTTRFMKPLIYQERQKPRFVYLTGEKDNNVFMRDEFIYGADARGAAGYGLWQMAYGSTGETNSQG